MDISAITSDKTSAEAELIQRAFDFTAKAHAGQKRESGEEYIIHPLAVALILNELNMDSATIIAGLLHDTLEDTPVTEQDIRANFGEEATFLVKAVTKIKSIENKDTLETSYQTLMKMFFAMADDIRVIIIKLADRLHNLQTLQYKSPKKQKEIGLKSIQIYAPIAERLNMGDFKGQIEDLAFPYAYPEKYAEFITAIQEYFEERKEYAKSIKPTIIDYLKSNGIDNFTMDYRVKHYYSLYRKLQRKNNNIDVIYDLVAFRIIVPDIAMCYKTLGILHQKYLPLPKLIKDYIALPKPNGYQSIHTTVFCEDGKLVEFQIRTPEMHDHAENGIAAHWAYAEIGKTNKNKHFKARQVDLDWIAKIRDWRNYIDNPKEFLNHLKLDLFKNRIFVFTPKGDVKDLPEGATPIDFAYAVHGDIGDHCTGAKVNEKMVALKYKLQNGDVCTIITNKHQKPTHDWLKYVQTIEAKRHIRSFLK